MIKRPEEYIISDDPNERLKFEVRSEMKNIDDSLIEKQDALHGNVLELVETMEDSERGSLEKIDRMCGRISEIIEGDSDYEKSDIVSDMRSTVAAASKWSGIQAVNLHQIHAHAAKTGLEGAQLQESTRSLKDELSHISVPETSDDFVVMEDILTEADKMISAVKNTSHYSEHGLKKVGERREYITDFTGVTSMLEAADHGHNPIFRMALKNLLRIKDTAIQDTVLRHVRAEMDQLVADDNLEEESHEN